jgi:hypothetical protein
MRTLLDGLLGYYLHINVRNLFMFINIFLFSALFAQLASRLFNYSFTCLTKRNQVVLQ